MAKDKNSENQKSKNDFAPLYGDTPEEIFVRKTSKYESFYLQLIILCCIVAAGVIAVAVIANVLIGIAVAIALAVIYAYFSRDELKRSLGITVRVCGTELKITSLSAYSLSPNEAWIPARIMRYDVTAIATGAFASEKNRELEILHIPSTVTHIENGAFDGCNALHTLVFACTEQELEKVTVEDDLSRFTLVFGVPYPKKPKGEKGETTA